MKTSAPTTNIADLVSTIWKSLLNGEGKMRSIIKRKTAAWHEGNGFTSAVYIVADSLRAVWNEIICSKLSPRIGDPLMRSSNYESSTCRKRSSQRIFCRDYEIYFQGFPFESPRLFPLFASFAMASFKDFYVSQLASHGIAYQNER